MYLFSALAFSSLTSQTPSFLTYLSVAAKPETLSYLRISSVASLASNLLLATESWNKLDLMVPLLSNDGPLFWTYQPLVIAST